MFAFISPRRQYVDMGVIAVLYLKSLHSKKNYL